MTPLKGKWDNVPTADLDNDMPALFIIYKRRFKDIVATSLDNFKVRTYLNMAIGILYNKYGVTFI